MLGQDDDGPPGVFDRGDDLFRYLAARDKVSDVYDASETDVAVVFETREELVRDEVRVGLGVADECVKFFVLVLQIDREELPDCRVGVEPYQYPVFVDEYNNYCRKDEKEGLKE